jgi:hypothetical protein
LRLAGRGQWSNEVSRLFEDDASRRFMRPISIHTAWRYPDAFADANFNFAHLRRFYELEHDRLRSS